MKKLFLIGGVALAALGFTACNGASTEPKKFTDSVAVISARYEAYSLLKSISQLPEEMRSKINKEAFLKGLELVMTADTATIGDYVAGMQVGMQQMMGMRGIMQMYDAGIELDRQEYLKAFAKAFMADSVSELEFVKVTEDNRLVQEKVGNIIFAAQQKKMEEFQKAQEEKYNNNKKAGEDFISKKMKADKDVKVTESGLAYKVTKMGTGEVATAADRVNVKYVGKTIDGKEFDSSNGKEAQFSPKGVVPGFGEALITFPAGTEVTIFIPENLGYGRNGQGAIEPGATLVFDLTIGEVVGKPAAANEAQAPAQTATPKK